MNVSGSGMFLLYVIGFGLVASPAAGLATSWIDRKVTARVQMRVGPPLLQPLYDIIKLLVKETCVPEGGSMMVFLLAPLCGLAASAVAATIVWQALLFGEGFNGDLIVLIYLLAIPAACVVMGSFASRNPLASLGGSREMKLMLAYELPFALVIFVPVMQILSYMPQTDATASLYSHLKMESIRLSSLLDARTPVTLPSGILALVIAVICMQAKLGLVPFDMSEAETEITGGAMVEYSGPPLAVFKLTRMIMLFTMPMFLVAVFCHGFGWFGPVDTVTWPGVLAGILKYVGLVVLVVLIRNTTPRVRIDQAVNFFWMNMISYSFVAVAMAFCGW